MRRVPGRIERGANGVVFLTGDRHPAEISKRPADHKDGVGYPLFDICSSSLNTPSGNFTKTKVRFANEINSHLVGLTYLDVNFGTVLVDWEPADPVVRLQVREESGQVVLQQRLTLSQLRPKVKPWPRCGNDTPRLIAAPAAVSVVEGPTCTPGRSRPGGEPDGGASPPRLAPDSPVPGPASPRSVVASGLRRAFVHGV